MTSEGLGSIRTPAELRRLQSGFRMKRQAGDAMQEEFGPVQSHSQAEIADMLAACTVSADIQQLLDRRSGTASLCMRAYQAGRST